MGAGGVRNKTRGVGEREVDDIGEGERWKVEDGGGSEVVVALEAAHDEEGGVAMRHFSEGLVAMEVVLEWAGNLFALLIPVCVGGGIYNLNIWLFLPQ